MVWALGMIGPMAAPAVPALIAALSDEDWGVRRVAPSALGSIGPMAAPSVPALTKALSNRNAAAFIDVASALGRMGPKAASAVPALVEALSDKDVFVRSSAAEVLGLIGPKAALAVPALAAALSDQKQPVRWYAVSALGRIGPKAAPAAPALITALSDEDRGVRRRAAASLVRVGVNPKTLWWVLPRVYWKELLGLVLFLSCWFGLAARFPRHRPKSKPKHLALIAFTAAPPTIIACGAVYHAITREWAEGFLPDAVLTLVPFDVAAVLSVAFVCGLAAVFVCQRKPILAQDEPE